MPQSVGTFWEIAYLFVVIIAVILLAYFASKWIAKRYGAQGIPKKGYIKIIDRLSLNQNQSMVIAKVGSKYMLLGISQHHIEPICELTQEELDALQEQSEAGKSSSFNESFKQALAANLGIKAKKKTEREEETGDNADQDSQ